MSCYTETRNPYSKPQWKDIYHNVDCGTLDFANVWADDTEDDSLAHVDKMLTRTRSQQLSHSTWGPYLRTMWNLVYSAICNPTTTTKIDMTTGKIIKE